MHNKFAELFRLIRRLLGKVEAEVMVEETELFQPRISRALEGRYHFFITLILGPGVSRQLESAQTKRTKADHVFLAFLGFLLFDEFSPQCAFVFAFSDCANA